MEISFLGSSNAFAAEGRYWSSFLVDDKYLFDCPPSVLPQLKQLGKRLEDIEVIFITHGHGDHFVGFPFLLLEYKYGVKREKDLTIVGPPGCEAWLEDFSDRVYPNITKDSAYRRIYVDAAMDGPQAAGPLSFESYPMNHVKHDNMQACGYRVKIGDKVLSYTGDTMFCEEAVALGEGADVYVVDCTYAEGMSGPEHMGLDDVKVIRRRIAPETTLVLTHLGSQPHLNGMANTLVAEDLKTITI